MADSTPLWLREFREDFACPPLPEGFTDTSWHNDVCPSYSLLHDPCGNPDDRVAVWLDHPEPAERELQLPHRFHVADYSARGRCVREAAYHSFEQAVALARKWFAEPRDEAVS